MLNKFQHNGNGYAGQRVLSGISPMFAVFLQVMVMKNKIKVLVVDDSALMRKALREMIMTDEELDVAGAARDGKDAIEKVKELKPDVITMDINMPEMDGLTSMQYILNDNPEIPVIIISSLTQDGALTTFEALALGAFDFVAKPSGTVSSNLHIVGREIIEKIKLAHKHANRKNLRNRIRTRNSFSGTREAEVRANSGAVRNPELSKVVVIGVSTGGPGALMEVIPMLRADLKAALIVVQHMPPSFTSSFAKRLGKACPFPFKEAEAGDVLADGRGFLAPGGYQLLVHRDGRMLRLSASPVTPFMPSVNVTMESVLKAYGGKNVVGVLMTGMGDDGADAMVKIRAAGGVTIAEDESTAIVFGMPRAAIERGGAEIVVPSYRIADEIVRAVNLK
jgi:Chemotaxis response regulator containing a CheY-like receiver domain and a methylesterase domain